MDFNLDVGSFLTAKDSLKSAIESFTSSLSSSYQKVSCRDGEVAALLDSYQRGIDLDLENLKTLLNNYQNVLQQALEIMKEADESLPISPVDLTIPTSLANVNSYNPLVWYNNRENMKLGNVYNVLGTSLIGALPNFVNSGNPQGFTDAGNFLVATNSSGVMYIYDKASGNTKSINLGSEYHLGGVSYRNGELYVATNGTISQYHMNDLVNCEGNNVSPVAQYQSTTTNNNKVDQVSFLTTTNDGRLITGQFHHSGHDKYRERGGPQSDLLIYNIQNDGTVSNNPTTLTIPGDMTKIQGACVYQKNGQDYYLLTSSYGTSDSATSKLYVATVGSDGHTLVKQNELRLPAGAEQVSVTNDGNIAVIYEGQHARSNITILDSGSVLPVQI